MPIIKIIPSKGSVEKIKDYITQESKTSRDFITTSGCDYESIDEDFRNMRELYDNPQSKKERTYFHIIISFNTKDEKINPQDIKEMTEKICRDTKIDCYQWFSAVHYKDRPSHIHSHVVVGNTAIRDDKKRRIEIGRSFRSSNSFRRGIMRYANSVCKEYGYEHSLVSEHGKGIRETMAERGIKSKNLKTWKDDLRNKIDDALRHADSMDEFKRIMKESYKIEVMENKKGELRYVPDYFEKTDANCIKPCHERRLGGRYGREEIESSIARHNKFSRENEKIREHESKRGMEK